MLDNRQIRQLSQIGMRGAFGQLMFSMAKEDERIMVLSADLGNTSGLTGIMDNLPNQFLNIGIAEQNMIGVATGLSLKGYRVFVTSFAPFATARCCEQIRVNLGEMGIPVVVVGIASGFEIEQFGNSHYGYDDIAFMRPISGLTILSPADTTELAKMLEKLREYERPVYLRLTKTSRKDLVYKEDFDYHIGKAYVLKESEDISLIATGNMVSTAMKVADRIEALLDISCGVVDMHTLKPIDDECIRRIASDNRLIVTLEEHSTIGGLGSAVAEVISTNNKNAKLQCIGVPDIHPYVGDYNYLIKSYGLDEDSITDTILLEWKSML